MKQSLYIHIPFCERKCYYCSFAVSIAQEKRMGSYVECLRKEARRFRGERLNSVYFGGGTPTLLDIGLIEELFKVVNDTFILDQEAEITIEANPESLDQNKARCLKDLGVSRVSLGVQSLNDKFLKKLGRCHDAKTAVKAFELLRASGFGNINLDLMYSLPGQTLEDIQKDVVEICALESEHLSLYSLSVEPNSRFYVQNIQSEHDGERRAEEYLAVARLLNTYGFQQYEVSNFSKKTRESRHNIHYWEGGNYIGLGMSAHAHQDGVRRWNVDKLIEYIKKINQDGSAIHGEERLSAHARLLETFLIGLRMNKGVEPRQLEQRYQSSFTADEWSRINDFTEKGLLEKQGERLRATLQGRLRLDDMAAYII